MRLSISCIQYTSKRRKSTYQLFYRARNDGISKTVDYGGIMNGIEERPSSDDFEIPTDFGLYIGYRNTKARRDGNHLCDVWIIHPQWYKSVIGTRRLRYCGSCEISNWGAVQRRFGWHNRTRLRTTIWFMRMHKRTRRYFRTDRAPTGEKQASTTFRITPDIIQTAASDELI